jgi:hypothetical protein
MPALATNLRNDLGRAIVNARRAAEAGARKALESLAVERHEPHGSMSPDERQLRNRLRARGRQLGDIRDKQQGTQLIDRLTHEVAYEHWHRMLFARFLAENDLLIHPEHGVAVSLGEIEDLAGEAGGDPHTMAAMFAQDSLPQIFRSGDPVFEISLAPETRQALDKLLDSLPAAVFTADDSLGWTYQYWQTEKKDEVNESGNKVGADELPAVTQLFTEHYMVLFLYHNTIGAWHAGKVLAENPELAEAAHNEEELRQAVHLRSQGGYDFEYLRFVREQKEDDEEDAPTGPWRPAAGTFEGWPKTTKELKILDPCCGSGHFLTEGLELLVRLRMDEEGLDLEDAIHGVLADNLHGLELDPRCTQIAAFNLAMAAWRLAGRPFDLPSLHIACSGLAVGSSRAEWIELAGDDGRLRNGMERLYDLFEQAPELGSLIDPKALKGDVLASDFTELQPLYERALAGEFDNVEGTERAVAARGMAKAAELLSSEFTLTITNVPYLGQSSQGSIIREFLAKYYKEAKADLATAFVERMLRLVGNFGTVVAVTPQNWLFLASYKKQRENWLTQRTWNVVVRLGSNAFRDMNYWAATTALIAISVCPPSDHSYFFGLDTSEPKERELKRLLLRGESVLTREGRRLEGAIRILQQADQLAKPGSVVTMEPPPVHEQLSNYAYSHQGASTIDVARFRVRAWEVVKTTDWNFHLSTPERGKLYSGNMYFSASRENGSSMHEMAQHMKKAGLLGGWQSGQKVWGKQGIACSAMNDLQATIYCGPVFDHMVSVIVPSTETMLPALWAYCSSPEFNVEVRKINQKVSVANATLIQVPFDLDHWQEVANEKYPAGLPEPQSDDPTQWLFHGHPAKAEPVSALQVAVGRLLGYRWPPELDHEMWLADEAREWVARCDELNDYVDEDGIVCLAAARGEGVAADRLRELLSAAFGPNWAPAKERELLAAAAGDDIPAASIEVWLRDKFFEEHCKLFHHRPFVWHIWDGNKNGFHCLVNAHKLAGPDGEARRTLEAITHSYLGDWIDRQKADQQEDVEGADARLAAARDLQSQLEKILIGEPPYDLFVRWKALNEQAIGWEPDINDGVRLSIRPFMNAVLRVGGKKGAGILRWKPNIKWKKDRGKEPQSFRPKEDFPWFWGCDGDNSDDARTDFAGGADFDGNRWNDLHYTLETKEEARANAASEIREEQV